MNQEGCRYLINDGSIYKKAKGLSQFYDGPESRVNAGSPISLIARQ